MVWTTVPVGSDSFHSKEGEGAGGANLQSVQWGLVLQVSAAGRFFGSEVTLLRVIPRQGIGAMDEGNRWDHP